MDEFIEKYQNFTVQDEKGKAYHLQVQKAIYQSIPKHLSQAANPKESTIYKNDDYLQFLERMKKKPESLPSLEVQVEMEKKAKLEAEREIEAAKAKKNPPMEVVITQGEALEGSIVLQSED